MRGLGQFSMRYERTPRFRRSKLDVARLRSATAALGSNCSLEAWRKETTYANESDWVFASHKTHGKTPRFGGMLVRDYLYPAAERAGIIFRQQDDSYVDSTWRGALVSGSTTYARLFPTI
jgi:hypothetical protein